MKHTEVEKVEIDVSEEMLDLLKKIEHFTIHPQETILEVLIAFAMVKYFPTEYDNATQDE